VVRWQRRSAGGAVGKAAPTVRLLQAAVRAVTNPPLDAIREELVTQIETPLGPEGNLLKPGPESCRMLKLKTPILATKSWRKFAISIAPVSRLSPCPCCSQPVPAAGLARALEELCMKASEADLPGLCLYCSVRPWRGRAAHADTGVAGHVRVHHHLVRAGTRVKVGLIVNPASHVRRTTWHCCWVTRGCGESLPGLRDARRHDPSGLLNGVDPAMAVKNYIKRSTKAWSKPSPRWASPLYSLIGARRFLRPSASTRRSWTSTSPGPLRVSAASVLTSWRRRPVCVITAPIPTGRWVAGARLGRHYQWRRDGEYHMLNPETIAKLQHATRANSYALFKEFSSAATTRAASCYPARLMNSSQPTGPSRSTRWNPWSRSCSALRPVPCPMVRSARSARVARHRHESHRRRSNCAKARDPDRYGTVRNSRVKQVPRAASA